MLARGLATIVVRLRWLVVLAWAAAAVAATLWLPSLQEADSASIADLVPEDAESVRTAVRSNELFPVPVIAQTAVVQRAPDGLDEEAQARVVERAAAVREDEADGISFALPLLNTGALLPSSREDSTTALTFLFFEPGTSLGEETALARDWAAREVSEPGDSRIGVTGSVPARLAEWERIENGLPWVTVASILAVFLILAVNYRSLAAPLVTLAAAGVAYLVAIRVAPWVGERFDVAVPSDVEPIIVVLLLGIVTDYSVFFLSGMRRRLEAGERPRDAALGATAQNLPIVVTAGLIVAFGAAALLAGRIEFFRAFGPGMALTVLVALAVSITLVPALLAIGGRASFWPARPTPAPRERLPRGPRRVRVVEPWTESLARFSTSTPVALLVVLLAIAGGVLAVRTVAGTELGFTAIRGLPSEAPERQAAQAAGEGFAPGILAPTELLVEQREGPLDAEAFATLEERLREQPGVAAVVGPADEVAGEVEGLVVSEEAPAGRLLIVLEDEPHGGPAIETLEALRGHVDDHLAESGLEGAEAGFTGETALAAETVRTLTGDLVRIAVAAFAVNLILLMIFLRALVAPLYLLFASALAFVGTLALTTFVFQTLLDHGELTYYVPFAVAVLLLSLGSDYNVFLVGRIWQEAHDGRSVRRAVGIAAPRASRTIAVAGLALAASFAMLAIIPLRQFQEFAFAMTVGVVLDAFVVRGLLVPSLVSLFGERSWWPARRREAPEAGAARAG